jgi:plastocyanin
MTCPTRRHALRLVGLGGLGLLAAACGAETRPVVVEMTGLDRFNPGALTVRPATRVVWKNSGTIPHTATCQPGAASQAGLSRLPSGAQAWDSGDVYPGQTWSHTFETAGTYVYVDRYDTAGGMVGTITVQPS